MASRREQPQPSAQAQRSPDAIRPGARPPRLPQDAEAPERVLRERLAEELELTRDARERREERLDALKREVDAGRALDLTGLELEVAPEQVLDLSSGHVISDPLSG